MAEPGKDVDVRTLFGSLQAQLVASLQAGRDVIDHAPTMGEVTEAEWVTMLSDHLPERYQASKAFVVDVDGRISDQIDVVVHDRQYSPLLFKLGTAKYVPAESVYAVFEAKQELNAENIAYAGSKAASVRALRRTSATIVHAGGAFEPRKPFRIVAGVLALESGWKTELEPNLVKNLAALKPAEQLDLGCVGKAGGFTASYEGTPPAVECSTAEQALIYFFVSFLERLQALGTVPAMDLAEYRQKLI